MRLKWITAAIGLRSNPILGLLINIVLPWDFLFAFLADRERADASIDFPIWLDSWYRLEAMSSLANLSYLNTNYSFPEINPTSTHVFLAKGLGHPLIPPNAKVCNDFALPELGQVMIITGSNMSGKSTLLKTIGVNLCLAFAGGPVNATILRTLPFRLHTCMRISDSITDGFSYFYAEVKCLRGLLESLYANETIPLLYLIDEIFRGTNNREREIGSQAFVQALINRKGIGLIATHDLGLASLAQFSAAVQNYHFRDTVIERQLHFDYKIYPGPCLTSNALKIMALEGLPVDQIK
jgi:DNA mismatch repair ATPase MutS